MNIIESSQLPHIVFFEPTDDFIKFLKTMADGRPIVEVGAGCGLLAKRIHDDGMKVLAVDIIERVDPLHRVYTLDATTMTFPPGVLPVMARPCHSEWIERTVENAMQHLTQFIYVGVKRNFAQDLGPLRRRYQIRVQDSFVAGLDGERAVCIYKLPQFKASSQQP